jgi:hypothetical protein
MSQDDNFGTARSVEIELQPTTGNNPTLVVAGNPRNIQFRHATDPRLDADTGFIYTTSQQLGIGATIPAINTKIHAVGSTITPATLRLESTTSGNSQAKKATVDFYQGSTFMGTIGKDNNNNNNLYIKTYIPTDPVFGTKPQQPGHLIINIGSNTTTGVGAWTPVGLGIGTLLPTRAIHVEGRGYFRDEVSIGTSTTQEKLLVNGNISTEIVNGKIGFRVWDNYATGSSGDTYAHYGLSKVSGTNPVNLSGFFGLTFATVGTENMRITQAGDVGINTPTPNAKLDVNGDTIVTGSFTTTGNATIKLLSAGSAATTSALVATSAGLVQKIDAAPIPKGGIILWSGTYSAIPTGWYLCNGQTINGIVTPNLQDKFIIGATTNYGVTPTTNVTGTATTTGGTKDAVVVQHSHNIRIVDPGHTHNINTNVSDNGNGNRQVQGGDAEATAATSGQIYNNTTGLKGTGVGQNVFVEDSPTGESGTNKNLPPYYALAYIMYGGI